LLIITVSWTLFYFTNLSRLAECLKIMFFMSQAPVFDLTLEIVVFNNIFWVLAAAVFCAPVTRRVYALCEKRAGIKISFAAETAVYAAAFLLCAALLVGQSYNPFLYWRF